MAAEEWSLKKHPCLAIDRDVTQNLCHADQGYEQEDPPPLREALPKQPLMIQFSFQFWPTSQILGKKEKKKNQLSEE